MSEEKKYQPAIKKMPRMSSKAFLLLPDAERDAFMVTAKQAGLEPRFPFRKWFDVLSQKFYVEEYHFAENATLPSRHTVDFLDFQSFYEYIGGNIYDGCCFFGYKFSDEEIEEYSIDLASLNFDSFISKTIDDYCLEKLNQEEDKKKDEGREKVAKMAAWIKKCKPIADLKDLLNAQKRFSRDFDEERFYERDAILMSLLIQKEGPTIKPLLLDWACLYGNRAGFGFDDALVTYGHEAAQYVIQNYGGGEAQSTRSRRKGMFRAALAQFDSNGGAMTREADYDAKRGLYRVRRGFTYTVYPEKVVCSHTDYFCDFDEFAKWLGGDLRGVNLSDAPVTKADLSRYKSDETTLTASNPGSVEHVVRKAYSSGRFRVLQWWLDENKKPVSKDSAAFDCFFDFVHYLRGDLSDADLVMCDGLENIKGFPGIKLDRVFVKSETAKALGLPIKPVDKDSFKPSGFEQTATFEKETEHVRELVRLEDSYGYDRTISYVSDIHLLHRFEAEKCETSGDCVYVMRKIAKAIRGDGSNDVIIAGDTSSDFGIFKRFIGELGRGNRSKNLFFLLGNHELWSFPGKPLAEIAKTFKAVIEGASPNNHLLHNNLFYYEWDELREIPEARLAEISVGELREATRGSNLIIFGGTGFSGENEKFNANDGIYRGALDRKGEIEESRKFLALYEKVTVALAGRNLVVATHMPPQDWGADPLPKDGFVHINGHNHRNFFMDDGRTRVYADNQIGYKGKTVALKQIPTEFDYDLFDDFEDGIREISRNDYVKFYRGMRKSISFNVEVKRIVLLKREGMYMFLAESDSGNYSILAGGHRQLTKHDPEYFYKNMKAYSDAIKGFLKGYEDLQDRVSAEVKRIGGEGRIHGCIVDINYYNHIYVNPLDGSLTPYYATSMTDKDVYENVPSLLHERCPQLYEKMIGMTGPEEKAGSLILLNGNQVVSTNTTKVYNTNMYRFSRLMKNLQFVTRSNIIRNWNDDIIGGKTKAEKSRLALESFLIDSKED